MFFSKRLGCLNINVIFMTSKLANKTRAMRGRRWTDRGYLLTGKDEGGREREGGEGGSE